jgi:hypothetical protein
MTIFLDLAGSLVVRASMVTVMLGLTVTMNNALYETTQRTNAASTVATVGDIVYTDLNQAVNGQFATWDADMMVFKAYTDSTMSQVATITYSTVLDGTTNLYTLTRKVGTKSVVISQNLVSVNFQYFDTDGHLLPYNSGSVDAIRVKLVALISYNTSSTDDRGLVRLSDRANTTLNDFKVFPPNLN